jgi:hypothetical protein
MNPRAPGSRQPEDAAHPTKEPLRVALLIDSYIQPRWIYKLVSDLVSSSAAQVVLIVKNTDPAEKPETKGQRMRSLIAQRRHLLYKLYSRLDAYLFKSQPDAFEKVDIEPLLPNVPVVNVRPTKTRFADYFPEDDLAAISRQNLDVALRFGFRILRGNVLRIARYGVWSYHHGDNLTYRGGPPGFWEVMNATPVTGAVLQILSEELDNGQVIYRSFAETDVRSVKRNANNYYWQSANFVSRKLRDLQAQGPCALKDPTQSAWQPYSSRLYKAPANREMCLLLAGLGARYLRDKIQALYSFKQWFVAYKINANDAGVADSYYNFKQLIPPKDRFWADPFPIKKDGKYYIFFEELPYKTGKGHLCVVEVDQKGMVGEPRKILDRPYHLSYPFVFFWNGEFHMLPETYQAGRVELYRCVSFPHEWEPEAVLLDNVRAVDATLAEIDGCWWMFVSIEVDGTKGLYELHLFYAETPLGAWRPHRGNPVKADVRSSRPAGRIVCRNGDYYRPAQIGPGTAMSINRIERLDPDEYLETEVSKVLPDWTRAIVGTHTLNGSDGLTVIDGQLRRNRFFG